MIDRKRIDTALAIASLDNDVSGDPPERERKPVRRFDPGELVRIVR
jgi:hypothetical protein